MLKTITEIRNAFWEDHPQYAADRRSRKRQNDYKTDIRCAFCDYLDYLQSNKTISEALRGRATL